MTLLSRRTLLKGGVAGLSTFVLGPHLFRPCAGAQERQDVSLYTGRVTQGIPTTCGLCPAGCGMLAFLDEGRLIGLTGNPEHPYNRGALCVFGSAAARLSDGAGRIHKPLRREGPRGEGRWVEIAWEEALQTLTRVLGETRSGGGSPAAGLAVCIPYRQSTPLLDRVLSFSRFGLLAVSDDHDHVVEVAALRSLDLPFDARPDLAKADRILNFGANPLGSIRRLVGSSREWAEGRGRGVQWVTLDPRFSETAAASDTWVPLRPGTDGVFACAVAHQIVKNRWEDRSFLERATDLDRETLWEFLAPWPPEKAAVLCQVSPEQICRVAEAFAKADRPVAILGSGVTARRGGLEDARAILLLNFLVGNIGRQGGWRSPGRLEWQQPDPWPMGTQEIPLVRGTLFWELQTGRRRIACLLSHDANPAVTDPDADQTARTLRDPRRVPFHVALSSHWNETVELADLVLPASTFLESWGLCEPFSAADPSPWVSLRQPVCRAEGGTRSLEGLLLEIAGSLGGDWTRAFPFRDVEEYYRLLLGGSLPAGLAEGAFREARGRGFVRVPERYAKKEETHRLKSVLLGGLPRPKTHREGKGSSPLPAEERRLITYASPTRGSQGYRSDWVEEIDFSDPMKIHPKAAEGLGLCDGDRVLLSGPAGSIETRVRLTEGIHPETVAMAAACLDRESQSRSAGAAGGEQGAEGRWWEEGSYGGNARRMVPWPEDPRQEAPGWMDTVVRLTRLEGKTKG